MPVPPPREGGGTPRREAFGCCAEWGGDRGGGGGDTPHPGRDGTGRGGTGRSGGPAHRGDVAAGAAPRLMKGCGGERGEGGGERDGTRYPRENAPLRSGKLPSTRRVKRRPRRRPPAGPAAAVHAWGGSALCCPTGAPRVPQPRRAARCPPPLPFLGVRGQRWSITWTQEHHHVETASLVRVGPPPRTFLHPQKSVPLKEPLKSPLPAVTAEREGRGGPEATGWKQKS